MSALPFPITVNYPELPWKKFLELPKAGYFFQCFFTFCEFHYKSMTYEKTIKLDKGFLFSLFDIQSEAYGCWFLKLFWCLDAWSFEDEDEVTDATAS